MLYTKIYFSIAMPVNGVNVAHEPFFNICSIDVFLRNPTTPFFLQQCLMYINKQITPFTGCAFLSRAALAMPQLS